MDIGQSVLIENVWHFFDHLDGRFNGVGPIKYQNVRFCQKCVWTVRFGQISSLRLFSVPNNYLFWLIELNHWTMNTWVVSRKTSIQTHSYLQFDYDFDGKKRILLSVPIIMLRLRLSKHSLAKNWQFVSCSTPPFKTYTTLGQEANQV